MYVQSLGLYSLGIGFGFRGVMAFNADGSGGSWFMLVWAEF